MNTIAFILSGKKSEITFPSGGNDSAHLYVAGFYQGLFLMYQGEWEFRPQKAEHGFSEEEVKVMLELLREGGAG